MLSFRFVVADVDQRELNLGLGEPQGGSFSPERRKPHGDTGYFRW
jgi:hypothetical protein